MMQEKRTVPVASMPRLIPFVCIVSLCFAISIICFGLFEYPALANPLCEGRLTPLSLVGSVLQVVGCGAVGVAFAGCRGMHPAHSRHKNGFFSVFSLKCVILLAVLFVFAAAYWIFPQIGWALSDIVMYTGVDSMEGVTLYTSPLLRQFVITYIISPSGVLAFTVCTAAYILRKYRVALHFYLEGTGRAKVLP